MIVWEKQALIWDEPDEVIPSLNEIPSYLDHEVDVMKGWTPPEIDEDGLLSLIELDEDSYALLYEGPDDFLVVGLHDCHPFVYSPSFSFYNTDGSTFEEPPTGNLREAIRRKALEFLFNQIH